MKLAQMFCLFLFLSLCGATEYYVRPTEPTDTSCPAQPCLTLSQYISNSDLYFKSNTVFKFLPGLHHANQTLDMQSVENVSLEGEYNSDHPIVIMDVHCSSNDCAGLRFHNITNLTIHSLDFSVYVSALPSFATNVENLSIKGFMYTSISTLHMHHTSIQIESSSLIPLSFGIAVFISEHILLHTLTTNCSNDSRCNVGIFIKFSQHTTISRTIAVHAQQCGIFLINSNSTNIVNTGVLYSGEEFGLAIDLSHDITIANTSVTESFKHGIGAHSSTNISLFNTSVMSPGVKNCIGKTQEVNHHSVSCFGIYLISVDTVALYSIRVIHVVNDGIRVTDSFNIAVENATVSHTGRGITVSNTAKTYISRAVINNFSEFGIILLKTRYSVITNVTVVFTKSAVSNSIVMYVQHIGIHIESSQYTTISSAVVMHTQTVGMFLTNSSNIDIENVTITHSGFGIYLISVDTVALYSIRVMHFVDDGIRVTDSFNIAVENATVSHTGRGITVLNTTKTYISRAVINNFSKSGIILHETQYSVITNVTIVFTKRAVMIEQTVVNGILIQLSQNAAISSAVVKHVEQCGIFIRFSWYVTVSNSVVTYAQYVAIRIESSQYTTISSAVVMHAQKVGMFLTNSSNINIENIMITHSGRYGLLSDSVHHMTVTNTIVTESSLVGITALNSTHIAIFNTSVMYAGTKKCIGNTPIFVESNVSCYGLLLGRVATATLYNIRVMYSGNKGIAIFRSSGIAVQNSTVIHVRQGIYSLMSFNIHISFTTISNFSIAGILFGIQTQYSSISNVTFVFHQFQEYAIVLVFSHGVELESIFLVPKPQVRSNSALHAVIVMQCSDVSISKSVFSNFDAPLFHHTSAGPPAVLVLFSSKNIYINDCTFEGNNVTGLILSSSHLKILGSLTFSGNRAYRGAAMIFIVGSTMRLSQNSSIYFVGNSAVAKGGAIYLDSSNSYGYQLNSILPDCFLQVEHTDFRKSLIFVNNSAGQGGDALYGETLGFYWPLGNDFLNCSSPFGHCPLVEQSSEFYANCSVLFTQVSSISPNTLSQVASDPVRVCICSNSTPECHMTSMAVDPIFPGQSFSISTAVMGNELGTVAGSVFAIFLPLYSVRPWLAAGEDTQGATQLHCNKMEYTIFSINSKEVLLLASNSIMSEYTDPTLFTKFPVYVNITLLPCPPGFALMEASARCDCSQFVLQLPGVSCNIKDQTIHRSGLVWVGSVKDENQTVENVITAKYCPLNFCKREDISVHLNQPDTQCEFNHSGILCGGCQPGLSLMLGGVQCGMCSSKNLALIIPFILAGIVLVFFLKISKLTTSEGFINSLVFYASIVKANEHIFLPQANTNPLTLFISWLNLDLGVQTCFFNGLSAYTKTWLQFVFPFYIWGITGVIIISARYSTRVARISGNNSVPVLTTLFLLSYAKLLGIIITSLSYTVLEYPGGQKVVWSADGNIDYLGAKHAPLFVAAVATLLFLWLPYTVLLFTGQWLYKCKLSVINRMLIKLKPFLDAHYGPLKDSHRYWFGALLLVRAVILLISALVTKNNFSVFIFSISVATFVLIIALMTFSHLGVDIRAYRSKAVSFFELAIFVNLVVFCLAKYHSSASGGSEIAASYTLTGIVFVQFVGVLILRIYSVVKNTVFHYFSIFDDFKEEGVWRYENFTEMNTIQYRNANIVL